MNPQPKKKPIRLKGADLKNLMRFVLERDKCCQACGSYNPLDAAHHIVYKSRGGSDTEENLITLCIYCHRQCHDGKLIITGEYPNINYERK